MKLTLLSLFVAASLLALSSCRDNLNGPNPTPSISDTIAHWPLAGNTNDVTGNGHNGTIVGATAYTTDRFGDTNAAMTFNGSTDISVPNKSDLVFTGNDSYTISLWTKTSLDSGTFVAKGPSDGSVPGYQFYAGPYGYPYAKITNTAGAFDQDEPGGPYPFDGKWHLLTLVVSAPEVVNIYVDSSLQVTFQEPGMEPELNNLAPLLIGSNPTGTSKFTGAISDVLILNRSLDPVQVAARFHEGGWYEHTDTVSKPPDTVATQTGFVVGDFGTTASILGVCFPSPNIGYACGTNGTVLKSTDSGTTWSTQNINANAVNLYGISFTNANVGIVAGDNRSLFQTTDGGLTWNAITSAPFQMVNGTWENTRAVKFIDQSHVMIVGGEGSTQTASADGFVLVSSDAGGTWTRSQTVALPLYGISLGDPQGNPTPSVNVVGNNGEAYNSTDFGLTWKSESVNQSGDDFMSADYSANGDYAMACTEEGNVYLNEMISWSTAGVSSTGVQSSLRTIKQDANSHWWVAGDNGVILYSINGSMGWTREDIPGVTTQWNQIAVRDPHTLAFVGANGTLYWYKY